MSKSWEQESGVDPVTVAQAELQEETGLSAGTIEYLGYLYNAYGYSSQGMHVFLATDLVQGERHLLPEEQDLIVKSVSVAEFEGMIRSGQIKDAATLSAYTLMAFKLREKSAE